MTLWNKEQVALALNVEIKFDFAAERVITDSRKIQKGDLFVAIKGENFDGNKYAEEAIKNGAVAAIISDDNYSLDKTIRTKDGVHALERLAYQRRKNSNAKIIAITGSVGKTTVKELLAKIFEGYYKIAKTEGNLNNHIGLPLSIANMSLDTKIGIFEMGMNHAGEIANLSRIAHPDIAIITNIGHSHIEFFESQEGIARAKAEIFDWLKVDGSAFIPADSEFFSLVEEIAENNGVMNISSFGTKINNPVETEDGQISAHIIMERYKFSKDLAVKFALNNILVALTVAGEIGLDIDDAIDSISEMDPLSGRGDRFAHQKTGAVIINDAYNASPESMRNSLINLKNEQVSGKKIAVLGDMLELGENSEKYHLEICNYKDEIDEFILCGKYMKKPAELIGCKHFDDVDNAKNELLSQLNSGDMVLIKGSNGSKMWKIVESLQNSAKLAS